MATKARIDLTKLDIVMPDRQQDIRVRLDAIEEPDAAGVRAAGLRGGRGL